MNKELEYMKCRRRECEEINAFIFITEDGNELRFFFWGKNDRVCHRLSIRYGENNLEKQELFLMIIVGRTWYIDHALLTETKVILNKSGLDVKCYEKEPVEILCHLFFGFCDHPAGVLYRTGMNHIAMGVLRGEIYDVAEGKSVEDVLAIPKVFLHALNNKNYIRFIQNKRTRILFKEVYTEYELENDLQKPLLEHQIRYIIESFQYGEFQVPVLHFLGEIDMKEALTYVLYLQKRELLWPYIRLKKIPESPNELYWLAEEASMALGFIQLDMSIYLLNKKNFFQSLFYETESYICDFVMTASEAYGLVQHGFLTVGYINLYFKDLASQKQTRLIMTIKEKDDPANIMMCIVLGPTQNICVVSRKALLPDKVWDFYENWLKDNKLCYDSFFESYEGKIQDEMLEIG
ncbi:MAG: hypothetical protein E7286_07550 [Lachnospiraceae bacterium]|nr:hypothetical protein [Lachnospiraceae bacterium]